MNVVDLYNMDCRDAMSLFLPDNSVDAIVCDPPYGLAFMGKKWDYDVPGVDIWAECLRVLKPGGHLLAFAGTRTQHRMAVRIEDAGFEIRDMIAWVYGCLDEATEVATESGVMPYHKTKIGDRVLCYDAEHGEYTYQPILEIVEYDYSDTAYRLVGDFGEQVVSRNHRVLVERGGKEAFQLAETLGAEACVPVLESLPALQQAVRRTESKSGFAQQDMQQGVCQCADWGRKQGFDASGSAQGRDDQMCGLRNGSLEAKRLAQEDFDTCLQSRVQRRSSRGRVGEPCLQGAGELEAGIGSRAEGSHDRSVEPGMEGGIDVPQSQRCVCRPADQVRSLPGVDDADGAIGRLCDGAPIIGGACDWANLDAGGVRTPHQPQRDGQQPNEPHAVCHERTAQGIRAWGGHRSAVVRVVPFHYTGKVWCLRVPTGAFVAVRNGVAFPTGNSGFPKSLDVSKAIDKAAGAERGTKYRAHGDNKVFGEGKGKAAGVDRTPGAVLSDPPVTEAARQWQGWGTALKPALEPITMARKPLIGTVAANVLAHGTGGLNIDGCRVGADASDPNHRAPSKGNAGANSMFGVGGHNGNLQESGRWPANLIHDGSSDVVAAFPQAKGQQGALTGSEPSSKTTNTFGEFAGRASSEPRGDTGSAARFMYCAKASKKDRDEGLESFIAAKTNDGRAVDADNAYQRGASLRQNIHPTVKPTDLMAYLCRLVTPPGGVVFDPFMGSGSTGKAALREGFGFIGCEMDAAYFAIAEARLAAVKAAA